MPLDQPGSLLSLRLVRIPRLCRDNDAHHFLSSRRDSPIRADAVALGRPLRAVTLSASREKKCEAYTGGCKPGEESTSVHVGGDVKLPKFLQKFVPHQPGSTRPTAVQCAFSHPQGVGYFNGVFFLSHGSWRARRRRDRH